MRAGHSRRLAAHRAGDSDADSRPKGQLFATRPSTASWRGDRQSSSRQCKPSGSRYVRYRTTLGSPCSARKGWQRNPTPAPKTEAPRVGAEPPDIHHWEVAECDSAQPRQPHRRIIASVGSVQAVGGDVVPDCICSSKRNSHALSGSGQGPRGPRRMSLFRRKPPRTARTVNGVSA